MNDARRFFYLLHISQVAALSAIVGLLVAPSQAAPWNPSASAIPIAGPGIPGPADVPAKMFSDFSDRDLNALADPEQVVAWDGLGGVRDSFDFSSSTRPPLTDLTLPNPPNWEVDAIANGGDALFDAVINDRAALLFSVGSAYPGLPITDPIENPPGPGPMVGDGLIYFNASDGFGPPPVEAGIWASTYPGPPPFFQPIHQIDDMNPPIDVDGLEVWGDDFNDNTDRYSLRDDPKYDADGDGTPETKVAVWEYDPLGDVSTPHTLTRDLAEAMSLQLAGTPDGDLFDQLSELMDVDATMVSGEQLLFSIAPLNLSHLPLPPFTLPDFDGGEIFVYDGLGLPTRFLDQGGYVWDTAFDVMGTFQGLGLPVQSENINALEAVAVPEPSSCALMLLLAAAASVRRNRHK